MTEVPVTGDEAHAVVETALSDPCVREARAMVASEQLRAKLPCAFPESWLELEEGQLGEQRREGARERWIAQQLRQDDGRQAW